MNATPKKALLIVNPIAGQMKFRARMFNIIDAFCRGGYSVTAHTTVSKGNATEIVKQYAHEHDIVVCCGGDGTLNEVVSGLMEAGLKTPIGYIPAGTTNDFANSLKLPRNILTAADAILHGKPRGLDVGTFNDRFFTYTASFGAFTSSSYSAPQKLKNMLGHFAYILQGMKDLPKIRPVPVRAVTPDGVYEDEYIFGAVCNSTSIGGLVKLQENTVDFNDGLFELILVKNPKSVNEFARILHCVNTRQLENDRLFLYKHTPEVRFESASPVPWSLDGEYEQSGTVSTVKNLHSAVTLIS